MFDFLTGPVVAVLSVLAAAAAYLVQGAAAARRRDKDRLAANEALRAAAQAADASGRASASINRETVAKTQKELHDDAEALRLDIGRIRLDPNDRLHVTGNAVDDAIARANRPL